MLLELRISNLALIVRADIQFGPGLNVLTGETGAGKSILVHALGLLAGDRATSDQVGADTGRASVEGSFDLAHSPQAVAFLNDQGIEAERELVILREIASDGRSRIRINGQMTTAATLRELGNVLIDLHGQHEHQRLLRPETHIVYLDEFGQSEHQAMRAAVREAWEAWQTGRHRLESLSANEQQRSQRLDMLQFQLNEIDTVAPLSGEEAGLGEERARLVNAEKLQSAAADCRDALLGDSLSGDGGIGAAALLTRALKAGREIERYDGSVHDWVEELQSALYEIEDAAAEARSYADSLEADPRRLGEIEARLQRLGNLKHKYGDSTERVIAYRTEIEEELSALTFGEAELGGLEDLVKNRRNAYFVAALQLSEARRALAARFSHEVLGHLRTLAMERARIEVGFEEIENGGPDGIDRIEFLFSANPGQPLRPLARIASGGEISRVMLALRSAMFAPQNDVPASGVVPILVFDEIDSGIGGVTAEAVGAKMRELARGFQVFCVTHLPQIARGADSHFRVVKESDDERTSVTVDRLAGQERVREMARMLGGESQATLLHAREMLEVTTARPRSVKL